MAFPLIVFDIISTEIALKSGGREINFIVRNKWIRWILTVIFKIVYMLCLFYIQLTTPSISISESLEIAFTILAVFYGIISGNNLRVLIILRQNKRGRYYD